jgi:hypothetical protein
MIRNLISLLKIRLAEKCQTSMALKQDSPEKLTVIPKPFPFNEGSLRKCGLLAQMKGGVSYAWKSGNPERSIKTAAEAGDSRI